MNIAANRQIRQCFSVIIIPHNPEQEMQSAIQASMIVDRATKAMIRGEISPDDLLEMVEPYLDDVDKYIEEVEENLAEIYLGD
ncbi:hypothetical protein I8752_36520 [Nostocaceae cyanobacterium CENA369]|uniref:Uncharacterized protein n=1 Tax=Dendronalium phyllosphericum CENA369 TaxID=1725256 RepID=A0A8J7LIT0_9NOST|nr:hypothetical protein [Dendronalium phyllosphericum]MBH8578351.1 hypothetical protein [Dendronalium phyllosphericum CENA369]